MKRKPLPLRVPDWSLRERMREYVEATLAKQARPEVQPEWYEEFAVELARVQRGQTTVSGTMRVVNLVRDKWLARGLHWPTVSRIMDNIVSLPFEMKARTSG